MAKFLLAYRGGAAAVTPKEQQNQMEAWMGFFGSLGDSVVDPGGPLGQSSTLASNGSAKNGAASGLSGFSIVTAGSLSDANDKAKSCPVLAGGGSVEVYEVMPMG